MLILSINVGSEGFKNIKDVDKSLVISVFVSGHIQLTLNLLLRRWSEGNFGVCPAQRDIVAIDLKRESDIIK